jgi:hypothetical protein
MQLGASSAPSCNAGWSLGQHPRCDTLPQPQPAGSHLVQQRFELGLDEHLFAVEEVHLRVCHLAVHQQQHARLAAGQWGEGRGRRERYWMARLRWKAG